jgi:hypothetical protein
MDVYKMSLKKSISYLESTFKTEGDAMPVMVKFLLKDVLAEVTEIQRLLTDAQDQQQADDFIRDNGSEPNATDPFYRADPQEMAMFAKEQKRRTCLNLHRFVEWKKRLCNSNDSCEECIDHFSPF